MAGRFTVEPGMNEVSTRLKATTSAAATSTDGIENWPTEWMEQIPLNWPHTTYAEGRKPGQLTTLHITNGAGNASAGEKEAVVAELIATLQWYPRPLGKQKPLLAASSPSSTSAASTPPSSPRGLPSLETGLTAGATASLSLSVPLISAGPVTPTQSPRTSTPTAPLTITPTQSTTTNLVSKSTSGGASSTVTRELLTSWVHSMP